MRAAIRYGVIFAVLVVVYVMVEHFLGFNTERHDIGQYTRLAGVLVPIIGVFVGIRATRREQGGTITFGTAFKAGAVVAVVQTTLTTTWFWLYGTVINPRFMETMLEFERSKVITAGGSEAAAAESVAQLASMYAFPNLQLFQEAFGIAYGVVFAAIFAVALRTRPGQAAATVPADIT